MKDTIAAISTAYGEGGIGIVRISGKKSKYIAEKIFSNFHRLDDRKLIYGHILDGDKILDEALVVYMKAPNTYTGEDIVEIQCHGSVVSLRKILDLTVRLGVQLADRGEFTKRAFLNGKMDLSQAEAVIDLIKAKSNLEFESAITQLSGSLKNKIEKLRKNILDILVNLTVNIDYPDEDIEEIIYENLGKKISQISDEIDKILSSEDTGRIIREGIKISIAGKPNVGKSSLMNKLLREDRAIVTDIEGTTRDIIQENIYIDDIPIVLTDTAGIRNTDDKIERIGIEKSKYAFNEADLVIFIIDTSRDLSEDDFNIIRYLRDKKSIVIFNKIDLDRKIDFDFVKSKIGNTIYIKTSMEDDIGIEEIKKSIKNLVFSGDVKQENSLIITNVRHSNLLREAKKSLVDAETLVNINEALELIEIDVKRAYEALGEIIGEEIKDDILDEVFSRFCLGK